MARCTATANRSGTQCKRSAIPGGAVCAMHGGKAPQVKAAAQRRLALAEARAELTRLGHPVEVDPAQAMLEMVYEAAGNVAVLRRLVQQLRHDMVTPRVLDDNEGIDTFRLVGGIAGPTGSAQKPNEAAPHVFVTMYDAERDRLVKWAKACRDAGVDERRLEMAEQQGRQLATVLRVAIEGFVAALAVAGVDTVVVDAVYREQVPGLVRGALEAASTVTPVGERS